MPLAWRELDGHRRWRLAVRFKQWLSLEYATLIRLLLMIELHSATLRRLNL